MRNARVVIAFRTVVSASMLPIVLVLFLRDRGLSYFEIAAIGSVGSVITVIVQLPTGQLGDRWGLKRTLMTGAIISAFGVAVLASVHQLAGYFIAEAILCAGTAMINGADVAMLYDSIAKTGAPEDFINVNARMRGRMYIANIGARLVAPALFALSVTVPLLVTVAIFLAGAVVLSRLTEVRPSSKRANDQPELAPSTPATLATSQSPPAPPRAGILPTVRRYRRYLLLSLISALVVLGFSNFAVYAAPFLQGRGMKTAWLGVALAIGSGGGLLGSHLAPRLPRGRLRGVTFAAVAVGTLAVLCLPILVGGYLWGIACYALASGLFATFNVLLSEEVNAVAPSESRATLLSGVSMANESLFIAGDPLIGVLIDGSGFSDAYLYLGTGLICATGASLLALSAAPREA